MASEKKKAKTGGIKRRLVTCSLVFLILYVGAHVISRTEGVRAAVADKISIGTRQPVSLEKCGMTPLCGLQLKGLAFQGVEMPNVKVSFDWFSFTSREKPFVKELQARNATIRFRRIPTSGKWEPLALHGVGRRLGAVVGVNPPRMQEDESLPVFSSYAINGKTRLRLRSANMAWLDENGRELAAVNDGKLGIKTGRFVDRKAMQTIVECGRIKLASGRELNGFRLEAFCVEGSDVVTVLEMSDGAGEYGEFASGAFWQELNQRLNQLSAVR